MSKRSAPSTPEFSSGPGKIISCNAVVHFGPNEGGKVTRIDVAAPKVGEVRLRVLANALCHTDVYCADGHDGEANWPCVLGHEAITVVDAVGEGVTSVGVGDKVIPCYTPQCREADCIFCASPKTNLCPKIRATQGKGVMPDGTVRMRTTDDAQPLYHFMGTSTFAEYVVVAEISCAVVSSTVSNNACLLGCGISTGFGAVHNTAKVEAGSSVAVFGLGAVGLAVVQAAKAAGATRIFAIDLNESKFEKAKALGATDCVNPSKHDRPVQEVLVEMTKWGIDYTFDATGNVNVMRSAIECAHRGWGTCVIIGVAEAGKEVSTRPFQFVTGRRLTGTAFGGYKSRDDVPRLAADYESGSLPIDHFVTHTLKGVEGTLEAFKVLHSGKCLRAVVTY